MKLLFLILFFTSVICAYSQRENKYVVDGNKLYKDSLFNEAEIKYSEAIELNPGSYKARFNKADALFRQKKYEEAAQHFGALAEETNDPMQRSASYHNLGNSLLMDNGKEGNVEKSIAAFKNALKSNPRDEATRYNLAFAQKLLKQQQQQQNKDNQDKKDEQNKDKNQQNQDKKDEQKNGQDKQQQNQQQQNQEQNAKNQQQQKMSKQDAQRLLEAMQNEERKVQERANIKKVEGTRTTIDKDW